MTTASPPYTIRRRTEIEVYHKGSLLTFVYKEHGSAAYVNVASSIEQARLAVPTMAETASLVHAAFSGDEPEFTLLRSIMEYGKLWAFTGSLYVPNKGIYIQDHPQTKNGKPCMNENELVKKLEQHDPSVRFVPFGFTIRDMGSMELAKNPYVIALAGEEGAEKLAHVADKHPHTPSIYAFESVDQPVPLARVSALGSDWGIGHGLGVGGCVHGVDDGGCAFGVVRIPASAGLDASACEPTHAEKI